MPDNPLPQNIPVMVSIKSTKVTRHFKPEHPDSIKVTFTSTMKIEYPMWLSLNGTGYAYDKACATVRLFGGRAKTVDEALAEWPRWRRVIRCRVIKEGNYFRVDGFVFAIERPTVESADVQVRLDGGAFDDKAWGPSQRKKEKGR